MIFVMSPDSVTADWPTLEIDAATFQDPVNKHRRLIPLLLSDCQIPLLIQPYLYIDWRLEDETQYGKLLDCCRPYLLREEVNDLVLGLDAAFPSYTDLETLVNEQCGERLGKIIDAQPQITEQFTIRRGSIGRKLGFRDHQALFFGFSLLRGERCARKP